jgi:hypothetical protein
VAAERFIIGTLTSMLWAAGIAALAEVFFLGRAPGGLRCAGWPLVPGRAAAGWARMGTGQAER